MKKLFFVRSGSTCRMLRILAAVMLLLPVNLQPVRASRQDAGAKSSLTVKMKDGRVFSRTQSIHKGHPADMLAAQRELIRCSLDGTTAEQREKDELTQKILRQTAADGSFQELLRTTQELLLTFFSDYVEKLRKKQQRPVLEAKAYMDAAYGKDITLEQVAERVGLSPAYFSKVFKQETGQGFAEYLTQLRIAAAKKYLAETRESVKSIAALVGYQDEKYFSKVFKKAVGIKPTVYRSLYA